MFCRCPQAQLYELWTEQDLTSLLSEDLVLTLSSDKTPRVKVVIHNNVPKGYKQKTKSITPYYIGLYKDKVFGIIQNQLK